MGLDFRNRVNKILNHCKREFGEWATLYPKEGGVYPVKGIFDNEFKLVDVDGEQEISTTNPAFGINTFDFDFDVKIDDKIKIRNLMYYVNEKQPDGQGGETLILYKCDHEQKVFKKKS